MSKPFGHGLASSGSNSTGVFLATGPVFALQVTLWRSLGGRVMSRLVVLRTVFSVGFEVEVGS